MPSSAQWAAGKGWFSYVFMLLFQKGLFLLCISISVWFTPGKVSYCSFVNIYWSQNIQHNFFCGVQQAFIRSTINMRILPVIQRCIYQTQHISSLISYQLLDRLVWADIGEILRRCYQCTLGYQFVLKALHNSISKISISVNFISLFSPALNRERSGGEKKIILPCSNGNVIAVCMDLFQKPRNKAL